MLRTKCIWLPPTKSDGLRISVMSRHTRNEGVTSDECILPYVYDLWLKNLAAPERLVVKYDRGEINFNQYSDMYVEYLRKDLNVAILEAIAHYALKKRVTFLCFESVPVMCRRTTLLYECWRYEPNLHCQNF